jgi:DNA-binding PadR family transcriptional regulator
MKKSRGAKMDRPEAYPITYGVLGLLAFWGPLSGYDLKRLFDHILAPMWGAAHSQIYNELRRMKELGWVEMQREEQETRPDRNVYHLTQAGQEALVAWQEQPPMILQLRDKLLLKVLFGGIVNLMQRWVYFLWKVGKRKRFWSLFSRRIIRKPLKNLLSGESSSRETFKLTIPKDLLDQSHQTARSPPC